MFTIPAQHATGAIAPGQFVNRPAATPRVIPGTIGAYVAPRDHSQASINEFIKQHDLRQLEVA